MIAIQKCQLPVNHGRLEPVGPLDDAAGSAWQVVHERRHPGPDGGGVEDVYIGRQPGPQQPPVGDAPCRAGEEVIIFTASSREKSPRWRTQWPSK